MLNARKEEAFCTILREELQLATGCTEPIAVAYCAARLRQVLGERPQRILAEVSGNILKNVKSVVVPNTGGRRGLPAAIAVGVVAGDPEARLQVIAHVTEEDTAAIQAYLDSTDIRIDCPPTPRMLDIRLTGWAGDHKAVVHVANNHTNIIYVERDGEVLLEKPHSDSAEDNLQDKSVLNVRDILTFAETVDVSRIEESVGRQIDCNTAIAREGLQGDWGANIGSTLLLSGGDVETEARAWAAAGSDARMNGWRDAGGHLLRLRQPGHHRLRPCVALRCADGPGPGDHPAGRVPVGPDHHPPENRHRPPVRLLRGGVCRRGRRLRHRMPAGARGMRASATPSPTPRP